MREIRKMLSEPMLARRATMFMAKRGLLSELIRSFWFFGELGRVSHGVNRDSG